MSQGIFNVSSQQPSSAIAPGRATDVQPSVLNVSYESLPDIVEKYKKIFGDKTVQLSYSYLESCVLKKLGEAIEQGNKYDNDFTKLSEIYADIRKINDTFIDDNCREGYMALQFYAKSIVQYLQALHYYIEKAQEALKLLEDIVNSPTDSDYEKSQKARLYIDKLAVFEDFAREEMDNLTWFHQFNNDTKQWNLINFTDDNKSEMYTWLANGQLQTYEVYKDKGKLNFLRETPIKYKDSREAIGEKEGPIQIFSSLNMVERLKYIHLYYKLIIAGEDTAYTVFPGDNETGFPCLPDVSSQKDTEATKHLGALEMFYVGYLTDRDGPINAVSSFFEVKVQALRENLSIRSKSISALNTYLEFINRGLNVLNSSQSGADGKNNKRRLPDGAMIALTHLCGGNMYNLIEAKDGTKCLVIENNVTTDQYEKGQYMLVSADKAGMDFLLGDDGNINNQSGNCYSRNALKVGTWYAQDFSYSDSPTKYCYATEKTEVLYDQARYGKVTKDFGNTFALPTRIDCANIIPNSVREYVRFGTAPFITTDVVSSWTDAFAKKTQFINTAIDTINTDIQVDRGKIDSFDSICSTFRSRAHEAHSNTAANVR